MNIFLPDPQNFKVTNHLSKYNKTLFKFNSDCKLTNFSLLQGDQVQITLSARLRKEQYMAFGISGAEGRAAMLGGDVVVAYWDTR